MARRHNRAGYLGAQARVAINAQGSQGALSPDAVAHAIHHIGRVIRSGLAREGFDNMHGVLVELPPAIWDQLMPSDQRQLFIAEVKFRRGI